MLDEGGSVDVQISDARPKHSNDSVCGKGGICLRVNFPRFKGFRFNIKGKNLPRKLYILMLAKADSKNVVLKAESSNLDTINRLRF